MLLSIVVCCCFANFLLKQEISETITKIVSWPTLNNQHSSSYAHYTVQTTQYTVYLLVLHPLLSGSQSVQSFHGIAISIIFIWCH